MKWGLYFFSYKSVSKFSFVGKLFLKINIERWKKIDVKKKKRKKKKLEIPKL